nr:unnamed protein product [Callosobruchus chinensis]
MGWTQLQGVPGASRLRPWLLRQAFGVQVPSWLHRSSLSDT